MAEHPYDLMVTIIDSLPHGVLVVDPSGRITLINKALKDLFGYTESELVGNTVDLLVPAESRGHHEVLRTEFFRQPEERVMGAGRDLYGVRKDGTQFPIEIGLNPVDDGAEGLVVAAVVDITQRKKMKERTEKAYSELQQLTYGVSHDLKAPLRSISGFVQILRSRYLEELGDEALQLIAHTVSAVVTLQKQINQLLVHSSVDANPRPFETVDLGRVLDDVRVALSSFTGDGGASITAAPLPAIQGDRAQMIQLFQNLIGNALTYRNEERAPKVDITVQTEENTHVISFKDNGLGIPEGAQERIFQVFERVHGPRFPGTGIGLSTCRRVAERHGGRIWLDSSDSNGSVFKLELPVGETHEIYSDSRR